MTCNAVLRVVASMSVFEKTFLVSCKKPEKHRGAHEPDLFNLPLKFGGTVGVWAVKIRID